MIKLKSIVKEIFDANLLENNVEITIYCDMDGVICDFEKQFETLTNTPPSEFESKNGTKEFWNVIIKEKEEFWTNMPPMPEFDYFKKEVNSITTDGRFSLKFLTSTSARTTKTTPPMRGANRIRRIDQSAHAASMPKLNPEIATRCWTPLAANAFDTERKPGQFAPVVDAATSAVASSLD